MVTTCMPRSTNSTMRNSNRRWRRWGSEHAHVVLANGSVHEKGAGPERGSASASHRQEAGVDLPKTRQDCDALAERLRRRGRRLLSTHHCRRVDPVIPVDAQLISHPLRLLVTQ